LRVALRRGRAQIHKLVLLCMQSKNRFPKSRNAYFRKLTRFEQFPLGGLSMRRKLILLLAVLGFLTSGLTVLSSHNAVLKPHSFSVILADGGDPPPEECGLLDICRKV